MVVRAISGRVRTMLILVPEVESVSEITIIVW